MPDNTVQTQKTLNERLLDMYYPNRNQISLFSSENLSEEQYIKEAYKKQNIKIGYYIEELNKRIG